jgi:hypothetical protein
VHVPALMISMCMHVPWSEAEIQISPC